MKPPFRSKQEVVINAPLQDIWAFSMDLTKIPTFHPRVVKVDLLSGKAHREPGVAYQCHLVGGKHTCIEKDIDIIPMEKIITVLPEDTYRIGTTAEGLGYASTGSSVQVLRALSAIAFTAVAPNQVFKVAQSSRAERVLICRALGVCR